MSDKYYMTNNFATYKGIMKYLVFFAYVISFPLLLAGALVLVGFAIYFIFKGIIVNAIMMFLFGLYLGYMARSCYKARTIDLTSYIFVSDGLLVCRPFQKSELINWNDLKIKRYELKMRQNRKEYIYFIRKDFRGEISWGLNSDNKNVLRLQSNEEIFNQLKDICPMEINVDLEELPVNYLGLR